VVLAGTLALGGAMLLGSARPAAAGTFQITSCPYQITMPGTYVLAADLACPGVSAAITIQPSANGVHLDLGNHTIDGLGTSANPNNGRLGISAAGVTGGPRVTGLRVTGGTLTGFRSGIALGECEDCQIVGSRMNLSLGSSIGSGGGGGKAGFGIGLFNSPGARIVGNTVTGVFDNGIVLGGNSAAQVTGNAVTGTGQGEVGIGVNGGTDGVRVTGNTATGNSIDLADTNPACVNTWRGNTFVTDSEGDGPGAGCIR
jgi:parallel beta-helix repeat protein